MNKVSDYTAVSSINFNELDTECIAKCFKMCLDNVKSKLIFAKSVDIFVPELLLVVELQVFTTQFSDMPLFA